MCTPSGTTTSKGVMCTPQYASQHIVIYSNQLILPYGLLKECRRLTSVDLSHLTPYHHIVGVDGFFLQGCSALKALDLSPLSHVTEINNYFLRGCTSLTSLDLSPLSNVVETGCCFMERCTGLTTLNLHPLSKLPVSVAHF